ncbi:sigma 54 modulation protein /30S ribosomal protein S30ea [Leptospira ryugenii]|uniref:Ribosome hibernation promoting factor n=1 Tax=Leptospira ryugenii TaxID=1917863 RepID=A0A2P2DYF7_9LEPT|nr:ribosome-associated translation inhibitor RaiA [Leptospira ryugenii]GBF49642.1 sigma 54 modulation protein /30S ribosomal protein S30ea [Leptospira ryugenii]
MKIKYTWKHLDRSEAAESYATEKLERVTKFVQTVINCDVSFESIHGEIQANLNLNADGSHFNAHNQNKDIYACIDGLESKIISQVSKIHDKKSKH